MKQIVVISGKGGTGKTSLVASLAALAGTSVLADCDVDAADLHLVVQPSRLNATISSAANVRSSTLSGATTATVVWICAGSAPSPVSRPTVWSIPGLRGLWRVRLVLPGTGDRPGRCDRGRVVPVRDTGSDPWFMPGSIPAGENSGKLVSLLRAEARSTAEQRGIGTVLIDGSPGIGCPVIASITGADLVLVVTEPTLSGLHDFERVIGLTRHFGILSMVVVNKYDINEANTRRIEALATGLGTGVGGRIRFDPAVTGAQVEGVPLVEFSSDGAASDMVDVWNRVQWTLSTGGFVS